MIITNITVYKCGQCGLEFYTAEECQKHKHKHVIPQKMKFEQSETITVHTNNVGDTVLAPKYIDVEMSNGITVRYCAKDLTT